MNITFLYCALLFCLPALCSDQEYRPKRPSVDTNSQENVGPDNNKLQKFWETFLRIKYTIAANKVLGNYNNTTRSGSRSPSSLKRQSPNSPSSLHSQPSSDTEEINDIEDNLTKMDESNDKNSF